MAGDVINAIQVSTDRKKRPYKPRGWRKVFLELLKLTGNVTAAATQAGITRDAAYKARRAKPEFAELWEDAKEESLDAMEAEAWRRAMQGVDEPVYYAGKVAGLYNQVQRHDVDIPSQGGPPAQVPGAPLRRR